VLLPATMHPMTDDGGEARRPGVGARSQALLLACLWHGDGADRVLQEAVHAIEDADWEAVMELAVRNRLTPLLHRRLNDLPAGVLPEEGRRRLAFWARVWRIGSMRCAAQLTAVCTLLQEADIPCLALKGAALAVTTGGSVAAREYHDVDLLIREDDLDIAMAVMIVYGYQRLPHVVQHIPIADDPWNHHDVLIHPETKILVELHRALQPDLWDLPDKELLWSRAIAVPVLNREIATLHPVDALWLVVTHAVRHRWGYLGMANDVADCMSMLSEDDWRCLAAMADASGSWRRIAHAVLAVQTVCGVQSAAAWQSRANGDRRVTALAARAVRAIRSNGADLRAPLPGFRYVWRLLETAEDRRRFLHLMVAPNELDRQNWLLPRGLGALHWVTRPFRLVSYYGLRGLWSERPYPRTRRG
jgi:hypothetical protein